MKTISDENFERLIHDANDNKAMIAITRIIAIVVIFMVLYLTVGQRVINVWFENFNEKAQCEIAIMRAKNEVLIREIQSEGLTTEEYLRWYEIYNSR